MNILLDGILDKHDNISMIVCIPKGTHLFQDKWIIWKDKHDYKVGTRLLADEFDTKKERKWIV